MRSIPRLFLALAAAAGLSGALALTSCGSKSPKPVEPTGGGGMAAGGEGGGEATGGEGAGGGGGAQPAQPQKQVVQKTLADVGLDPAAIDKSVNPCDDFYEYACGAWIAKTEIPSDKARWGRSFDEINERNLATLRDMLEAAAKAPGDDPIAKKLGAYYGSCMDEKSIEKTGLKPLDGLLKTARGVKDAKTLARAIGELHRGGSAPVFFFYQQQDARDATRVIGFVHQAGLGLPDRDYYLKDDDEKLKGVRDKYVQHLERLFGLTGLKGDKAKAAAADVLAIETEIAKISKSRVELRDPEGVYNRIDRKGLAEKAPAFPWDEYFTALKHKDLQDVNVTSVPFIEGLNKLVTQFKPEQWRNYLVVRAIDDNAEILPKAYENEKFTVTQAISGQPELPPRWKRCVRATDAGLGDLLGQLYVKKMFGPESKQATETMVSEIRKAMGGVVKGLDWMDAKTKERALTKLNGMVFQIGYPNKWRDYGFAIDPKSYGKNALAAAAAEYDRQLDKIGKPLDRDDWQMTAPTVNAYYDPQLNVMVFPAGILQPPFFNAASPVAVNLGAMGMVVGHELTHGFDDEGSQYDVNGNLKSWWEADVRKKFDDKTGCVEKQYNGYAVLPGVNLNGKLTLGENIADNGGIKLAFRAYKALRADAPETIVADGYNEDQQFFLSTAQAWCQKIRDDDAKRRVTIDPHSAAQWRVNGPMSNLPEFAKAFTCPVGSKMAPKNTCAVW